VRFSIATRCRERPSAVGGSVLYDGPEAMRWPSAARESRVVNRRRRRRRSHCSTRREECTCRTNCRRRDTDEPAAGEERATTTRADTTGMTRPPETTATTDSRLTTMMVGDLRRQPSAPAASPSSSHLHQPSACNHINRLGSPALALAPDTLTTAAVDRNTIRSCRYLFM